MSDMQINAVLQQIRTMTAAAQGGTAEASGAGQAEFSELLKQSVNKVNEAQKHAGELATAFEQGAPNVDLAEVMIAMQKASVSFQALTQVRNHLVSAYQEIMNMQV